MLSPVLTHTLSIIHLYLLFGRSLYLCTLGSVQEHLCELKSITSLITTGKVVAKGRVDEICITEGARCATDFDLNHALVTQQKRTSSQHS